MFDISRVSQVSGTVRTLEWTNPHTWLWLILTDDKGASSDYAFEGSSIGELMRRFGWTKNTVTPGDKVIVSYMPQNVGPNRDDRRPCSNGVSRRVTNLHIGLRLSAAASTAAVRRFGRRAIRAVLAAPVQAVHDAQDSTLFATRDGEFGPLSQGRDQEYRVLEADAVCGHQLLVDLKGLAKQLAACQIRQSPLIELRSRLRQHAEQG